MSSDPPVTLSSGALRLELNPSVGGSIRSFEWIGAGGPLPILRECRSASESVLDAGSFPLVPYVNRIRAGKFDFRGRRVEMAPNMQGDPSPLHGQGWLSPWAVDEATETRAVLRFRHEAGEWPWAYDAKQEFELDESGLMARLTCRNASADAMPCGLGHHPYFPCGGRTILDTMVSAAWTVDAQTLPVNRVPADGRFDLQNRPICGQQLDNGFAGWGGEARISDPDWPFRLVMSCSDARFFQVYSPAEGGFFVAEPVTHANAALNAPEAEWPELGMKVLEPGEEMSLAMLLEVIPARAGRAG